MRFPLTPDECLDWMRQKGDDWDKRRRRDPDATLRIPVLREIIINYGTPDEAIVYLADNKVFKVWRAYNPITRWLLNTGWFDGKKEQ